MPPARRVRHNGRVSDAERLRESAADLRSRAAEAEEQVEALLRDHPEDAGHWTGPTATTFYDRAADVRRRLGVAAADLRDYADTLDAEADAREAGAADGPPA